MNPCRKCQQPLADKGWLCSSCESALLPISVKWANFRAKCWRVWFRF